MTTKVYLMNNNEMTPRHNEIEIADNLNES